MPMSNTSSNPAFDEIVSDLRTALELEDKAAKRIFHGGLLFGFGSILFCCGIKMAIKASKT